MGPSVLWLPSELRGGDSRDGRQRNSGNESCPGLLEYSRTCEGHAEDNGRSAREVGFKYHDGARPLEALSSIQCAFAVQPIRTVQEVRQIFWFDG